LAALLQDLLHWREQTVYAIAAVVGLLLLVGVWWYAVRAGRALMRDNCSGADDPLTFFPDTTFSDMNVDRHGQHRRLRINLTNRDYARDLIAANQNLVLKTDNI
jgi:hypothetical protein